MTSINNPTTFHFSTRFDTYQSQVENACRDMRDKRILDRLWSRDHTLWKPDPDEIHNRLGWLQSAETMSGELARLRDFARDVHSEGYTHALLLGMGGSSLAPAVFAHLPFSPSEQPLKLSVLDSTDPNTVSTYTHALDPARTLFLVSSKSGTTVETLSLFKHFYNQVAAVVESHDVGRHFVAITDPDSPLAALATQHHFREVFLADPQVGGRYAALSHFGLVPAALVGVDLARLFDHMEQMRQRYRADGEIELNPGAHLGAILGEFALLGRDKVTLLASPSLHPFGAWVEQLLAESTGKEGKGLIPILHEPLGLPGVYGNDRLFVHLSMHQDDEAQVDQILDEIANAGHPVVHLHLDDPYEIGEQFFLWEMATALAAYRLEINPFDQPNVEAAKQRTRDAVKTFRDTGALPDESPAATYDGMRLYGSVTADSPEAALNAFLAQSTPGDYVALQAYLPLSIDVDLSDQPSPELSMSMRETTEIHALLLSICGRIRDKYRLAATFGYGPRYLHSTGQLHKGDAGQGLFIQFTADAPDDVPIPDAAGDMAPAMRFSTLEASQAIGDRQALQDAGRRIVRFHLGDRVVEGLRQLNQSLL
jgi:glucose-6-phosphate isomerase